MKYLTGKDRNQLPLFVGSLEEAVEFDNEVRLVAAFDLSWVFTPFNLQWVFNILPNNAI